MLFVYSNSKRDDLIKKYEIAKDISDSAFNLNQLAYDYVLNKTERGKQQWYLTYYHIGKLLDDKNYTEVDSSGKEKIIVKEYKYLNRYFNQIVAYNNAVKLEDVSFNSDSQQINIKRLLRSTETINTFAKNIIDTVQDDVNHLNIYESRFKLVIVSLSFFIIIINSIIIYKSFYNPLLDIINNARIIASGNLDQQITVVSQDEMGELAATFDKMRVELKKYYMELMQEKDSVEREAIRYRALLDTSMDGIHILDWDGNLVECNDAFLNLLGYTRQESKSLNVKDWDVNYNGVGVMDELHDLIKSGRLLETRHKRKDGSCFDVAINANGIELDGKPHLYCSGRDITPQKNAEQARLRQMELERSNTELEQFAYVASHDLQEPLRMVASYTQLLQRRYSDVVDDKGKEYIFYAVDGAKRMQQLINDLLTFSRLSTMVRPFEDVDLNDLIEQVKGNLGLAFIENNAVIQYDDLPIVNGDKSQLTQLFQNLISNAVKFHADKPPLIQVKAEDVGNFWQISVSDNGIGIDKKYQEKIFVIFQRLHSTDKYQGTGIGLAVCKKVVERHGGQIWVESKLNMGTTFYFTISK